MKVLSTIKEFTGIQALLKAGGDIYVVGGIVRDFYLGKESKDIDLIIRLLTIEQIESILKPHGFVKEVGKSFGILKFQPNGWTGEDIDIAIPRTEKKIGLGYQGFEVQSDPFMSIEEDLKRRDFTMNSIAISLDGKLIDPFHGIQDINNGIVKATSKEAFIEDPLRMLRAVQFASRFDFIIEQETMCLIKKHVKSIKEISPERYIIELDKIHTKGNSLIGYNLLVKTGISEIIFDYKPTVDTDPFESVQFLLHLQRGDFYYLLLKHLKYPSDFFIRQLKGDVDTSKFIKALSLIKETTLSGKPKGKPYLKRLLLSDAYKISKQITSSALIYTSEFLGEWIKKDLYEQKFILSISDLAVTGDEIKEHFQLKEGKEVGDKLKELFLDVVYEVRENTKEDLLYSAAIFKKVSEIVQGRKGDIYDRIGNLEIISTNLSFDDDAEPDKINISDYNRNIKLFTDLSIKTMIRQTKINNILKELNK